MQCSSLWQVPLSGKLILWLTQLTSSCFLPSPKFFRKLAYITTLSELAHHIPLTQIDIPPAVYQYVSEFEPLYRKLICCRENLKHERKISLPVPTRSSIFGVPLEDLMGYNGEKGGIPRVVKDAIQFLRETGMFY
jgi:Rho GTPase-activating protein 1